MQVFQSDQRQQPKRKILIVDDDPSIIRVLTAVLGSYGTITSVDGGNKAIEILRTLSFDLILTDYEMPQGTGLDLLEYMEKHGVKIPTIMITAFGTKDLLMKTIRFHIFGFVEKPFTREGIESLVKSALQRKEEDDKRLNLAMLGATMGEIVHEISSPLTALDLRLDQWTESSENSDANKMKKSVEKIKEIIVTTKDSIRREYNRFKLSIPLLDALDEFQIRATQLRVTVSLSETSDPEITGDRNRIRQVVVILVNNAIDAASESEEKKVEVQVREDPSAGNVNIYVTDSGPGVPTELREELFVPFFSTKGRKGTGLGLSIAKRIATEHGGNVYLDNSHPKTRFVLSLPLATPLPAPASNTRVS